MGLLLFNHYLHLAAIDLPHSNLQGNKKFGKKSISDDKVSKKEIKCIFQLKWATFGASEDVIFARCVCIIKL